MSPDHRPVLSRRGFCLCCMSVSAAGVATGGWLTPARPSPRRGIVDLISSDAPRRSPCTGCAAFSVLEGSGGNIAVLTGGRQAPGRCRHHRLPAAVAGGARWPRPGADTHLINTHWHFDHADGNEWLHEQGAAILAHENTQKHLPSIQRVEDWDFDFPPRPAGALPDRGLRPEQTLKLNGTTLALKYYGPAHTDSDISVHFARGRHPALRRHLLERHLSVHRLFDRRQHRRLIRAADANLAAATDATIVVPGHGAPVSNRAGLQAYRDMLVAIRGQCRRAEAAGMSLAEIVAAKPTAAFDAKWGQFVIGPALFTRLVYAGV